jgi:ribosomal protein L37AE/L43A
MPQKKTPTFPCNQCGQLKKEAEMQSFTNGVWRCSQCHSAEAQLLDERRKTDRVMEKTAQDIFNNKWVVDSSLKAFAKKYKLWDWQYFWTFMDELRKEEALLKEREVYSEFEEVEEELPESYLNWDPDLDRPPVVKVNWSEV